MSKSVRQHNWKHLKLHYEHYRDIDFLYWEKRARHAVDRIRSLKREKSKHHYYLELYTDYVQIFEATMINMMAITSGQLFKYLFIDTGRLNSLAEDLATGPATHNGNWADEWIRDFVFQRRIFNGYRIEDPETKIRDYKMIVKEAAQDYLKDRELLNAFKHGFRIKPLGESSLSISRDGDPNARQYLVGKYNAGIAYYSSVKPKGAPKNTARVFKNQVRFNWERVYQQVLYLSNALENTKQTILLFAKPKRKDAKITCNTLKVTDRNKFYGLRGSSRWSEPIGRYSKITN